MSDDLNEFAEELKVRRRARELGMGNVVRFKDGTPIHGSLREASAIWFLMALSFVGGFALAMASR